MEVSKLLKDEISSYFFNLQEQNEINSKNKREILYKHHPALKDIDTEISLTALRCARKIADKSYTVAKVSDEMIKTLEALKEKRVNYIKNNNITDDYINTKYSCNICKDTGFVNNKMCKCYKQKLIEKIYEYSNMSDENKKCSFKNFKIECYSDVDEYKLGITPLQNIKEVLMACKKFCENFEKSKNGIYICGNSGVGKTYLSCCIANYLVSRGHTVLYQNAFKLFGFLEDYKFLRIDRSSVQEKYNYIYDCDMLIIDDLGTEFSTPFAKAAFFDILNSRIDSKKCTVINSNLSSEELSNFYSNRVKSRIHSSFLFLSIIGDDIRNKI